jgi:HAE1 family hydrophobic/amphiphilic exporter-1
VNLIRQAIRYPVTTTVGVLLLVLFGTITLLGLPIQLTPTVEEPVITVSTLWPGASPLEIERDIVEEQEEQLKNLDGLIKMESQSQDSTGTITLTFAVGADLDTAMLRTSTLLDQVPSYPADAEKPVIRSVDSNAGAIAWFVLTPTDENGYEGDISTLFDFMDDEIKPEFERVPGVAASNIYGGREHEMRVIVDPAELAARAVTINEVAQALERENRNYSGGDFDEGKRRYIVRTVGEYRSPDDIEAIVVAVRDDVPVYLRDVGHAEIGYRKAGARVFNKGRPIIAINAVKEAGSNVLETMKGIKAAVEGLNAGRLGAMGLVLDQVYDETEYIYSAIRLVLQSLVIGGSLAILVLLVYLRSGSSTLVISVAIPISVVGAFLALGLFGRTLNVISLAGMAFAVGMVVDNSIVVLENIYRHRQLGRSRADAAYEGAREVWGAVLASTLTTIAVFVPVIFMKEEVGQLFGDIALAVSCAVGLSLLVSITVIPTLSARILRAGASQDAAAGFRSMWGLAPRAAGLTERLGRLVHAMTGSTTARIAVVAVFTAIAVFGGWLLVPKREYLPTGNLNFAFGQMLPPPGYSLEEVVSLQEGVTEHLRPLFDADAGSEAAHRLPGGGMRNYFFVALPSFAFMGAAANEPLRVAELIPEFRKATADIPGAIFFMSQRSIFERGRGEGRTIDVEIKGPELERLIALGGATFGQVLQQLPGAQAFPIPGLDLGNPEVRVVTHRRRAAELGLSNRELGFAVSSLIDGAKASDFQYQGKEIDLRLMVDENYGHRTHLLGQLPIAAPDGSLITLGSVADIEVANGPVQINHSERQRTITIQVTPDTATPLEAAMDTIRGDIVQPMIDAGELGGLYQAELSGAADKLVQTIDALRWNLLLALIITYLLMAALFENFVYPLVIMISVPLAALGGVVGLRLVGSPLDMLTMLGFIILIGTVVNNAILIVHQSLNRMREEGTDPREAIESAVRTRVRPIFMSVSTSVLGMLPLVLFPGAGSELYRGLGSVVVGGLIVSTLFTLLLVPAMFSLALDLRAAVAGRLARLTGPSEELAEPPAPQG